MLDRITPLILTYNEQANIRRTLDALAWARQIVVLDSFSSDATQAICAEYATVRFLQRRFDQHATQWNYGLEQIKDLDQPDEQGWTLALDADHIVSADFVREITTHFSSAAQISALGLCAFRNGFIYCQDGKPLKGSLYPPLIALFKTTLGHYRQEGHTQRLAISGTIVELQSRNFHDDRKPFSRWLKAQRRYALLDAEKLSSTPFKQLRWTDRVRIPPFLSPLIVLFYVLFFKGLVLSGYAGIKYSLQRALAEYLLHSARLQKWLGLSKA
jgi:glycosyltransferase involved in cell wall biosynthesis